MSKEVTLQNAYNFAQGTTREVMDKIGLLDNLKHEQAQYRLQVCKDDCLPHRACKVCGCSLPGRAYVSQSCNRDRFPDMMEQEEWDNFKQTLNVE